MSVLSQDTHIPHTSSNKLFLMMPSSRNAALFVALVASQAHSSAAFIAPHKGSTHTAIKNVNVDPIHIHKTTNTQRDMSSTGIPPGVDDIFQKYGENSRQYRRTVYTHEDWVRHRSSDRFARNLSTFFSSSIYRSLFKEVTATTAVATAVVIWNMVFGTYQDLGSVTHNGPLHDSLIPILCLPLSPFTLSSPSLGLLLGKLAKANLLRDEYSYFVSYSFVVRHVQRGAVSTD